MLKRWLIKSNKIPAIFPSFFLHLGGYSFIPLGGLKKLSCGIDKWIFIISTPKWVITGYEARSLNVGWELLCEVF